jgi:hypothetical protein
VQTNGLKFSVRYSHIYDIIGEEEWVDGEMNTLSNIGSHQIVNLSFGAKKKEKNNNTQRLLEDLSTHNAKPMHYLCSRCKGCLIFMGV